MWRNLESEAIYIGLDLNYFWSLTPKQYEKYVENYRKKEKDKMQITDYLNHLLGQYISYAFNNPKEYPKKPYLHEEIKITKVMTINEMERQALNNTIMMGGAIKK